MRRILALALGLGLLINAAWMLGSPLSWYGAVPGVAGTGPANLHFIRDIGCAYLVASLSLFWLAFARTRAWPAALASGAFLSLHGVVHLADAVAGREHGHALASEVPTVFLPAALVVWLALAKPGAARGVGRAPEKATALERSILGRILERSFASFERTFGYDLAYMRFIVDGSTAAFLRFGLFFAFSRHEEGLPKDALFAAKIIAAVHEDCGPCTQLVVTMAEHENVAPSTLRAILALDLDAMGAEASLGCRFARATLARDITEGDRCRAEAEERWGKKAVISLAFAVASSRVFPGVKYALGFGRTCSRVSVAGEETRLAHLEDLEG